LSWKYENNTATSPHVVDLQRPNTAGGVCNHQI